MPDAVRAVLGPLRARSRLEGRPVRIHRLDRVWVAGEGLVFDETGSTLFAPTVTQHSPEEIAQAHAAVAAAVAARTAPGGAPGPGAAIPGRTVLCRKRGAWNYGHWLVEMLPRAFLARAHLPDPETLAFAVQRVAEPLAAVMREGLAALGIPPDRIRAHDEAPALFEALLLVEGLSEHAVYLSPLLGPCFDAVAAPAPAPPRAARRRGLMVSRRSHPHRQLLNAGHLELLAHRAGWRVVDPAGLGFLDQVALFRDADAVLGVCGAGLAGAVFAPRGARLVSLAPAGMVDNFFPLLAALRGLAFEEWRCEQVGGRRGPAPWDTDLALPARAFRALLAGRDPVPRPMPPIG